MKRIIFILLSIVTVGATSVAWYTERKQYTQRLKQDFLEHAFIRSELSVPMHQLLLGEMLAQVESGELAREEFERRMEVQLFIGLAAMYKLRNDGKEIIIHRESKDGYKFRTHLNSPEAIRKNTGRTLSLLGISSAKELNIALKTHDGYYEMFGQDQIFDEDMNLKVDFSAFIDECIAEHTERMKHREFLKRMNNQRSEADGGNG